MLSLDMTLSTEITIQSLMNEASNYLNSEKYKLSFELYIEALLSVVKEFKQIEFINDGIIKKDVTPLFLLANTCLTHVKFISTRCSKNKKLTPPPPPIPPKPSKLSMPKNRNSSTEMKRSKSRTESIKSSTIYNSSICSYSDDEDVEIEDDVVNKNEKRKRHIRKRSTPSLKIITNKSKMIRRSSTSNISTSAPSSPLSSVSNPFNAVKSFLSLPIPDIKRNLTPTLMDDRFDADERFLLANGMIDPHVLVTVQTNNSDGLSTTNNGYLPMIPQAPLVTLYKSLQNQLTDSKTSDQQKEIHSSLNRVRNIHMSATTIPTILQFHPVLIAYQLTLIDSTIFRNIPIDAILSHSTKTPHPSIVTSTDFFNYLTRMIEHAILLQQEASGRAQLINHWIKVAGKCHELKNYQTLKAIISALGTPPIQRLKRSWQFIPKKSMNLLEDLSELMSETSNYDKYRERLGLQQECEVYQTNENRPIKSVRKNSFSEPTVPFLGIFIHDMTYLTAAKKQQVHNRQWKLCNEPKLDKDALKQDPRVSELLQLFKNLQRSPPYSPNLSPNFIKDLVKARKRKLSQALSRTPPMKKIPTYHDDDNDLSFELQQCLVTQYLLTRSWVSEKTVDELSLVRESTKSTRSYSVTESSANRSMSTPMQRAQSLGGTGSNVVSSSPIPPVPLPPPMAITTSNTTDRNSTGSVTSNSSNNSRPISLEDEELDKKFTGFWLFSKKNSDQSRQECRSPKQQYSYEEKKSASAIASPQGYYSIFRKDFWKNNQQQRMPLMNFHSDPTSVLMQKKSFIDDHQLNRETAPNTPSEILTFSWE